MPTSPSIATATRTRSSPCAKSPKQTVKPKHLEEAIVSNLQRVRIDEDDETDELAILSESAEALRLTAAAPPRPTPVGGDYE